MKRLINHLADRALSVVAPRLDANAAGCDHWYESCGGGKWRECWACPGYWVCNSCQ